MSRNYAQYRNSPKLSQWLDIVSTLSTDLIDTSELVRLSYDIDTATSYELNVLGQIVGQPRNFESYVSVDYLSIGSVNLGTAMLKPFSNKISQDVSDDIYRILIRSKIAKNASNATVEEVLQSIVFITGITPAGIVEGDMSFGVNFDQLLPGTTRLLLDNFDVIPKPQGVQFLGYTEEPYVTRLGRSQLKTQLTGAF